MESTDDLKEQVRQLTQLDQRLNRIYHAMSLRCGLSDAAHCILYAVYDASQPYTQQDLCQAWSYSKQTVHSAVALLRQRGYVTLRPLAKGGNQKAVELTEEGRRFCQAAVVPLRQAEIQAFARLTIEERQTFLSLYRIQLDYLQEEVQKIPRFEA